MSSLQEVVQKDIELLFSIQTFFKEHPKLDKVISIIISKHPWRDISMVIWIIFVVSSIELGVKHFWVVIFNLIFAAALRRLLEAKRPFEYDNNLQPKTDLNPESYAFPSLESYMSVVIMGHIFLSSKAIIYLPLGLFVTLIVGISRVYSLARFPHQIIGSWILGFIGLLVGMFGVEQMKFHKMSKNEHNAWIAFIVLGFVCNLAISIENNDSRLMGVPKKEFIKVLSEILSGGNKGPAPVNSKDAYETDDDNILFDATTDKTWFAASRPDLNDETDSLISDTGLSLRKKKYIKSDSLYYLQKNIEEREEQSKMNSILEKTKGSKMWNV